MYNAAKMRCGRCGQPLVAGERVYVLVSATVDDPSAYLGVSAIGCSGDNGVVHQKCWLAEALTGAEGATEPQPPSGAIQRSLILDEFHL